MTYGIPQLDASLTFADDDPVAQRRAVLNLAERANRESWPATRLSEVLDQLGLIDIAEQIRADYRRRNGV